MTIRDDISAVLSVPFARRLEKNGKTSSTAGDKVSGSVSGTLDARLQRLKDKAPDLLGTLFNGTSQTVFYDTGDSSTNFFGAVTISLKAFFSTVPASNQVLFAKGSAYRLYANSSGNLVINNTTDTGYTIPAETVLQIAVTFDASGNGTELVVNGVSEWSDIATPGATVTQFSVASRYSSGNPGLFASGRIWQVVVPGYLNWPGISSSDWSDVSGNGNDATVVGF